MSVNTKEVYNGCIQMHTTAEGLKENYNHPELIYVGNGSDPDILENRVAAAELKARNWARAQENPDWKEDILSKLGFEDSK